MSFPGHAVRGDVTTRSPCVEGRYDSKKTAHRDPSCTGHRRSDGAFVDGAVAGFRRFDRHGDRSKRRGRLRGCGNAEKRCHRRDAQLLQQVRTAPIVFRCCRRALTPLTVTASGFSKTTSTANVNVGQATIADVKMAVGHFRRPSKSPPLRRWCRPTTPTSPPTSTRP